MLFWPSKSQWKTWHLPSKLTAIGTLLGLVGLVVTVIALALYFKDKDIAQQELQNKTRSPRIETKLDAYSQLLALSINDPVHVRTVFLDIAKAFWDIRIEHEKAGVDQFEYNKSLFLEFILMNGPILRNVLSSDDLFFEISKDETQPSYGFTGISRSYVPSRTQGAYTNLGAQKAYVTWFCLESVYLLFDSFNSFTSVNYDHQTEHVLLQALLKLDKPKYIELNIYSTMTYRQGAPDELKLLLQSDSLQYILQQKVDLKNVYTE